MLQRTTLVTGASRPFGLELVRLCLKRGDQVIAASRSVARATALADLRAEYQSLELLVLDPADAASVAEAIPVLQNMTSAIDLLLVAPAEAGPHGQGSDTERNAALETLSATSLVEHYRRHAVAPVLMARTLLPWLATAEQARILFVSTWPGSHVGEAHGGAYAGCASDAGMHMLARSLARDVADKKIIVCVGSAGAYPGAMQSPTATGRTDEAAAGLLDIVDQLSIEQSGAFVDWKGDERALM